MNKQIRIAFCSVLLLVLAATVAGHLPYSHPVLSRTVLSTLSAWSGYTVSANKVSLIPFKGIRFNEPRAMSAPGSPPTVKLKAREAWISYRVLRVLMRSKDLGGLLRNTRGFVLRDEGGNRCARKALRPCRIHEIVREVKIFGADIAVKGITEELVDANDATAVFELRCDKHPWFEGTISVAGLRLYETWLVRRTRAKVSLKDSVIQFKRIRAGLCQGIVRGEAAFDLSSARINGAGLSFKNIELEELASAAETHKGTVSGALDLELTLRSTPLVLDSVAGTAKLRIHDMIARDTPLQRSLGLWLSIPQLSHVRFEEVRGDFTIEGGKLYAEETTGRGDPLDFVLWGWVGLDGYFSQQAHCLLDEAFVSELRPAVKAGLERMNDGRYAFGCTAKGTYDDPGVSLSKATMIRQVLNMRIPMSSPLLVETKKPETGDLLMGAK